MRHLTKMRLSILNYVDFSYDLSLMNVHNDRIKDVCKKAGKFFKKIKIHTMLVWTATTRHGVTRKKSTYESCLEKT